MEITHRDLTAEEQITYNKLAGSGIRFREQRAAVAASLIIMTRNGGHANAEAIANDAFGTDESGLATTYRNLKLFEKSGLIERRNFDTGREYYEIVTEPHAHLVNVTTGKVTNVKLSDPTRKSLESVAILEGLNLSKIDVVIYGEETAKADD